ncbi:hypothetical protein [Halostreptopolyspora alba]|uniref:Uncharacterized protein n=1 Tax=Halostreptopolyspora alba TaxID=2487137 RepID=A0A3N0EGH6_9ACTN|nr:hypothetical protein EFW17_03810 [Nocardiopsaceae bacterium YIM 96095]
MVTDRHDDEGGQGSAFGDSRPLADRRSQRSDPFPEPGDEFAGEHAPSETDPAAWSPRQSVRDNRPEWPTRA